MRQSEGKVRGDPGRGRVAQTHGGETKRSEGGRRAKWEKDGRRRECESERLSAVNGLSKELWQEAVGV